MLCQHRLESFDEVFAEWGTTINKATWCACHKLGEEKEIGIILDIYAAVVAGIPTPVVIVRARICNNMVARQSKCSVSKHQSRRTIVFIQPLIFVAIVI